MGPPGLVAGIECYTFGDFTGVDFEPAATSLKCDDCEEQGFERDLCNCGVCGSYGGCTWSCDASAQRPACQPQLMYSQVRPRVTYCSDGRTAQPCCFTHALLFIAVLRTRLSTTMLRVGKHV
jgi:hypothetical protein